MTTLAVVQAHGTYSALPAFGIAGRVYFATDTGQIFYDNGSAWVNVLPALAAIQQQAYTFAVDSGSANAYVANPSPAPTLVAGSEIVFKAANANTGASTLTVGATTAAIKKQGTVALAGGEIAASQIIRVIYDGTNFQM